MVYWKYDPFQIMLNIIVLRRRMKSTAKIQMRNTFLKNPLELLGSNETHAFHFNTPGSVQ